MKKYPRSVQMLFAIVLLALVAFAINTVATGYKIDNGGEVFIDAHGICKRVKNTAASNDYFVPTKTSTEWQAFRNADGRLSEISLDECGVYGDYMYTVTDSTYSAAARGTACDSLVKYGYSNWEEVGASAPWDNVNGCTDGCLAHLAGGSEMKYYRKTGTGEGTAHIAKVATNGNTNSDTCGTCGGLPVLCYRAK